MRITSWNFLHGQVINPSESGVDDALSASLDEIASDIIALQEVDFGLKRSAYKNQIEDIAHQNGASDWGFAPALSGTPGETWRALVRSEKVLFTNTLSINNLLSSEESKNNATSISEGYYGIGIISNQPVQRWLRCELGKSPLGMPLAVGGDGGKMRLLYVKDEPRVAIAAVLNNGWTIINTHLSFVPLFNIYQFLRLSRWAKQIEREHSTRVILLGDFNLPWGIPSRISQWRRATQALSYPSWSPKISFDYILVREKSAAMLREVELPELRVSDHRPISVEVLSA